MRNIILLSAIILAVGIIAGCGDDGGGPQAKDTPPMVSLTNPAGGATGVSLNRPVWISFSEPMDEASLDAISIEGITLAGREYDDASNSVTLLLDEVLDEETEYEVRVPAAVQDKAGNEMEADYTFSYTTGAFSCAGLYDPFEPNDEIASAKPVDLNTWYRLVPSCGGEARYDYYEFTLADTLKANVRVDFVAADTTHSRWGIHFYRADGEDYSTLGTSYRTPPAEIEYSYSFLPGTYYARIFKYDDDPFTGVYNFIIETSEPCVDDQYEDNDFEDEAKPLTAGLHEGLRGCHVDSDFFTIEMAPGKTLKVTMTEVSFRGGTRLLYVWGPGVSVGGTNSIEPRVEMVLAGQAGTFYIRTQWWTDDVTYDLNVEVLD